MKQPSISLTQVGAMSYAAVAAVMLSGIFYFGLQFHSKHASANVYSIHSSQSGYCLDVHHDSKLSGAPVDSWSCNDSDAQSWRVSGTSILHGDNSCLTITPARVIVAAACNAGANQVWLADKSAVLNPQTGQCLALPGGQPKKQLTLASCSSNQASIDWLVPAYKTTDDAAATCSHIALEGQRVACVAEQEWAIWQSGTLDHNYLLNKYTNSYGYEEWCADFVSYVYKTAGYPFSGGESDGWDENIASNIQNMGFSLHPAGSYMPQAGDVAFFTYPGGHVEIVVAGGKIPTFIYGNSGTVDPTTGNGDMATNTITSDSLGQVAYYLSPNP